MKIHGFKLFSNQTMHFIRFKFKISLRETEGFFQRKEDGYEKRNDAVKIIRGLGNDRLARSIWSKLVGYNRRVVAESMMARWKRLFGGDLRSQGVLHNFSSHNSKALIFNHRSHREHREKIQDARFAPRCQSVLSVVA